MTTAHQVNPSAPFTFSQIVANKNYVGMYSPVWTACAGCAQTAEQCQSVNIMPPLQAMLSTACRGIKIP